MSEGNGQRRLSRGWAITLLVLVVVLFVGGSTVAALSFVTTLNARPIEVTCTVDSTFGDATSDDGESGRPGFSVQTSGAPECEDFYVRDVALRGEIEVGETYVFTISNLIGYTNVEAVASP
ncbi:hypothetical protein HD599_002494 [Conyzicola lurida]|uniref:Uncharacterized protein n=1 Tax=Conyzicola lurida TaxID=1172621 RepID=A0A841AQW5_9MICO|nr:hypothetical protein [Conyzicola lurida]MBB5844171.1 hypothetical protein [Conyzicola lurida]